GLPERCPVRRISRNLPVQKNPRRVVLAVDDHRENPRRTRSPGRREYVDPNAVPKDLHADLTRNQNVPRRPRQNSAGNLKTDLRRTDVIDRRCDSVDFDLHAAQLRRQLIAEARKIRVLPDPSLASESRPLDLCPRSRNKTTGEICRA